MKTLFALCVAAVLVAGCGGADETSGERGVVVGSASQLLPSAELRDWKSYADHVVVFTVDAERELPPSDETRSSGEGMIGRRASVTIEKVLWSADAAPAIPQRLEVSAPGWVLHGGSKKEFVLEGAPRISVGERYVAPFVLFDDQGRAEWGPLASEAQMPLQDGRVRQPDQRANGKVRSQLAGKTSAEVLDVFRRTAPDPRAAAHMNLRPVERARTVYREAPAATGP